MESVICSDLLNYRDSVCYLITSLNILKMSPTLQRLIMRERNDDNGHVKNDVRNNVTTSQEDMFLDIVKLYATYGEGGMICEHDELSNVKRRFIYEQPRNIECITTSFCYCPMLENNTQSSPHENITTITQSHNTNISSREHNTGIPLHDSNTNTSPPHSNTTTLTPHHSTTTITQLLNTLISQLYDTELSATSYSYIDFMCYYAIPAIYSIMPDSLEVILHELRFYEYFIDKNPFSYKLHLRQLLKPLAYQHRLTLYESYAHSIHSIAIPKTPRPYTIALNASHCQFVLAN